MGAKDVCFILPFCSELSLPVKNSLFIMYQLLFVYNFKGLRSMNFVLKIDPTMKGKIIIKYTHKV